MRKHIKRMPLDAQDIYDRDCYKEMMMRLTPSKMLGIRRENAELADRDCAREKYS